MSLHRSIIEPQHHSSFITNTRRSLNLNGKWTQPFEASHTSGCVPLKSKCMYFRRPWHVSLVCVRGLQYETAICNMSQQLERRFCAAGVERRSGSQLANIPGGKRGCFIELNIYAICDSSFGKGLDFFFLLFTFFFLLLPVNLFILFLCVHWWPLSSKTFSVFFFEYVFKGKMCDLWLNLF